MNLSHLDLLKEKLDQYRPLPKAVLHNLHEDLVLRWTYHSNAIEGNTLTLKETKVALEGITVGGKTLREHFEVINHQDAILFVEALVQKAEIVSEWQIKNIHQLILKNIDDENAGQYRRINVIIAGAKHIPPDFIHVPQQMESLICEYQTSKCHPVERAAKLHERRLEYYETLDKAHIEGNYTLFFSLIYEMTLLSFAPYWHALCVK